MEKAYAKFGAWRASVRDTRLKDVMVGKGQKVSKKKKKKKSRLSKKLFFSLRWSHFDSYFGAFPEGAEARPLDHR